MSVRSVSSAGSCPQVGSTKPCYCVSCYIKQRPRFIPVSVETVSTKEREQGSRIWSELDECCMQDPKTKLIFTLLTYV